MRRERRTLNSSLDATDDDKTTVQENLSEFSLSYTLDVFQELMGKQYTSLREKRENNSHSVGPSI
jgi:hypothetical protein